jgi:DNA (cytosine-5)-methyltransferase 1
VNHMRELVIDGFAGGGGASTGIALAIGRSPDIAINHDEAAISMHRANHPESEHYCQNIWKANPSEVVKGRSIGLAWFSPDCKHFSKAKGGKPVKKNIRDLAWVVVAWAQLPKRQRPRTIVVENVEEFVTWGPLGVDERPCIKRGGEYFRKWVRSLRDLKYEVDWRELVAADYGSPTIRKRLFVIAKLRWNERDDGRPIVWPDYTHGKPDLLPVRAGKRKPWRTAAEIIDWSLPCPSIFEDSSTIKKKHGLKTIRPLAENTLARIARGVQRYVIEANEPFIVPVTHPRDQRVHSVNEPMRTVTGSQRGDHAVIVPTLINTRNGERKGQEPRVRDLGEPYATVTSQGSQGAVVAAFLAQHNTDMVGHDAREPVSTIVQKGCTQAVVSAGLINLKGSDRRQGPVTAPCPTQTAGGWHIAEVRAFIMKYHRDGGQAQSCKEPLGTGGCKARFGLLTVEIGGESYAVVDIGMRMLTPRELFRAQGFSNEYQIDCGIGADGKPRELTKTEQIRMCGNSVCPQVAEALVQANYVDIEDGMREPIAPLEFALVAAE